VGNPDGDSPVLRNVGNSCSCPPLDLPSSPRSARRAERDGALPTSASRTR
jgi:hypothetical protein